MQSKIVFLLFGVILFAKTFNCQYLPGQSLRNGLVYPENSGIVSSIGLSGLQAGNCRCNLQALFPSSIVISSDDLQIGGQVAVSGSMPIYATVAVDGQVPSSGQAEVKTGCGSNVVLNNAGVGSANYVNYPNVFGVSNYNCI